MTKILHTVFKIACYIWKEPDIFQKNIWKLKSGDAIYLSHHFIFRGHSIAHTRSANGWWKVTLKENSYIAYIDIYNRMDCCQQRLRNAKVFLDGRLIGTVPQVNGRQKYRIPVNRRGKYLSDNFSQIFVPLYETRNIIIIRVKSNKTYNENSCALTVCRVSD